MTVNYYLNNTRSDLVLVVGYRGCMYEVEKRNFRINTLYKRLVRIEKEVFPGLISTLLWNSDIKPIL